MNDKFEICYLIYKVNDINQREIANLLDFSLGKVNRIIKELGEEELLTIEDKYNLTEKGHKFLERFKVDNAIIMAAGFGSRFVPLTYDTPKGLLEVHGEVMIERQIKQLIEVGITDITIIVGYLKEKFDYLTDKFGVKLLYNPDYSIKNNISSLYYAQDLIKNTYILTSDIYMPENLYRPYEAYSYYASEYFEGATEEWAIYFNKNGLIQNIDSTGGNNVWTMFGPAFFTKEFSTEIIRLINFYYSKTPSAQWYWEDVYMRHLDTLDMYVRKYESGSILEFESLEELRVYDSSYFTFSRSEILDTIARVFNCEQKDIVNISTLKEGMTNDSFLFIVNGVKYVFRAPGKGTDFLINRKQEAKVYDVVLPTKVCDDVIYINPDNGYKISKFINNSRTLDVNKQDEIDEAMNLLRNFHNMNLEVEHNFDIFERMEYYLKLCKESDAIMFQDFEEVYSLVMQVQNKLMRIERPKVLAHVDPVADNFLIYGNKMLLLDWEYAGMADPIIDLAMFIVYSGIVEEKAIAILRNYLQRHESSEEKFIFYSYISLAGYLWSLWTQFKQANGENFGTYGIEQYQYAHTYSIKALNL